VTVPDGTGMDTLLLIQAILASFGGILTFTFFRDRPANIFPSRIAKMKAREKARVRHESQRLAALSEEVDGMGAAVLELGGAADLGVSEVCTLWAKLIQDREFMKLTLGFGTGLAIFNALMTVIQQVIHPCGYTSDDAGMLGGILIGSGLVGAMVIGPVLDCTKAYKVVLKVGMSVALLGVIGFVLSLKPDNILWLSIAVGCLGFVMLPMLPVSLETAAEHTYPVPEDCSSALLMTTGQIVGIPMIFGLDWMIDQRSTYDGNVWTPAAIFLVTCISACVLLCFWFNGDRKRLEAERQRSFSGSSVGGGMSPALTYHSPAHPPADGEIKASLVSSDSLQKLQDAFDNPVSGSSSRDRLDSS